MTVASICDFCQKPFEPTAALAFFYPELAKVNYIAFPWACRYCKTVRTDPYIPGSPLPGEASHDLTVPSESVTMSEQ